MVRYKNVGKSPWRRPTGESIPPGGTFEATVREQQRITRRGYFERLEREPSSLSVEEDVRIETNAKWTLRMSPEMYLKLHPSGGHAALAREIMGVVVAGAATEDTS